MTKVFGTESLTPTVKPMTRPNMITSGDIEEVVPTDTVKSEKKADKKKKKSQLRDEVN